MRIAYAALAEIPSDRANTIQVMKVCQSLAQLGHAVTLLLPDITGSPAGRDWESLAVRYGLQTRFELEWIPPVAIGKRRLFSWQAAGRARRMGADMLYVRSTPLAVAGQLAGMPVILEMHELPSGRFGPLWYRLFLALPGRKRILSISRALRERLGKYRPLPAEDMLVAPDGVDLERYRDLPDPEAARRELGLASGLTVLCTGHLYEGRGVPLFVELAGRFPQVNFVWAGGRPQEVDAWRQRAARAGLRNLTFTGFVPNRIIPRYQAAADVLLMPYERRISVSGGGNTAEFCSPLKMFEYMAAGRAILSSDLPVLREVLDDRMAVFCPPEDAGAWSSALAALLADEKQRQSLGQRARQEVERYSWAERSRSVLEGLLDPA